jgi:hypothetical protein
MAYSVTQSAPVLEYLEALSMTWLTGYPRDLILDDNINQAHDAPIIEPRGKPKSGLTTSAACTLMNERPDSILQ